MDKKKQQARPSELDRLEQIKKLVIIAMFSDDQLMDRLVLKGGNAVDLIHRLSMRASVDVDFSMQDDPADQREAFRERVERALRSTFREARYEVFDLKIEERPEGLTEDVADFWGGYAVEFKLIEKTTFEQLSANVDDLRRRALRLGQGQKFLIDISRFEYIEGKQPQDLDGYRIFVYSPVMIVCEKLRAICQQMPEYGPVVKRKRPGGARARDFLDIHTLVTDRKLDLTTPANRQLLTSIFKAKRVPVILLGLMAKYREFHRTDFPSVLATIRAGNKVEEFDFYFDFVLGLVEQLKPLGNV